VLTPSLYHARQYAAASTPPPPALTLRRFEQCSWPYPIHVSLYRAWLLDGLAACHHHRAPRR
jgi:hypothetical protein